MTFWVSITNYLNPLGKIPQRKLVVLIFTVLNLLASVAIAATLPPVVDSFTATPPTVLPGETVSLSVDAHDPDCADICTSGCGQYIRSDITSWSASAGLITNVYVGSSGSPYTTTADWQAPDVEGTYTISVYLADSGSSFMCGGRASMTATLDIVVAAVINEPPVVQSVTANPTLLYPEEQSQLGCSATDPEGETLTYTWSATSGEVAPTTGGSAVFTAGSPGIATLTCTATDPAGISASDTVSISVIGAEAEKALAPGLVTPQRLDITSWGDLFVADRSAGGLTAVNLFSGELVYRLPFPNVTSVAVDWNDDLLVAGADTAQVLSRRGTVLLTLDPVESLGKVSDVAVDSANRRYGVLYRKTGRVVIFDELGAVVGAFGSTGEEAEQFMSPNGLAAAPDGTWLVGDTGNGQIKRFDLAGTLLAAFGARGGGVGEFMQIDDVVVDDDGVIFVSDSFQDWVVSFNPDGSLRESMGTYGDGVGQLKTASGVAPAESFDRVIVASLNGSSLQVFKTTRNPVAVAPEPAASLSTTTLTFTGQTVGTSSPSQVVTLTNVGDAPLGIRDVVIGADFRQTSDCGSFLDPGQSCAYTVSFVPNRTGLITATMVVDTSATGEAVEVTLSGTGTTPPMAVLSPTSLLFTGVQVGKTSAPQSVTLSNAGTDPLSVAGIEISGDYTRTTTCGGALAGGASCTISVVFAPQTSGDHIAGILSVVSDAVGSPHVVTLDGAGLPADAALTIGDATATEGGGDPAEAVFTVTMTGYSSDTVTVEYTSVPLRAAEDEDYTPVTGTLSFPDGVTTRTIRVPITDDDILEPEKETFRVELHNPVNATFDRIRGTGTIIDDELCPSPNLLLNPDAEEPWSDGSIPGWIVVDGDWQQRDADPDPYEGNSYFAAGTADFSELQQTVDVTAFAATIDADAQQFAFEAFIRTGGIDLAAVVVEYLADNGALLDVFDPGDISSDTNWTRVADFHAAPPLTRQIRVRLIGQRLDGETTDAFFDHIALVSLRVPTMWVDGLTVYEGGQGESVEAPFAAQLACGYFEELRGWIWTSDRTAVDGEDYLASDEPFVMAPGEIEAVVPVTVLGDGRDEDHEYFDVNLTLDPDPGPAVTLFGAGVGVIYNDDFCAQAPSFWQANPDEWPVDSLVLGGIEYNSATLLWLLSYDGSDISHELARELVAARLNLAIGSDPSIYETVDAADDFLTRFPPGSQPSGQEKKEGRTLTDTLIPYNDSGCPLIRRVGGRRQYCDPCGE